MKATGVEPPLPNRPALRAANRNSLARLRRAAASSDSYLPFCERGRWPPFSHIPPGHAGSEPEVRRHCLRSFSASPSTPPEQKRGDGLERRPPVGTRGPQGRATAYRCLSRSAGTAWNADLWSARAADRAAEPRIAARAEARGRFGTPTSGRHARPTGPRNRVSPPEQKRGDGLERRPPAGTRGPRGRGTAYRRLSRSAGTAWNADLWSAPRPAGPRNRVPPAALGNSNR